ncbi:MFS transporter [Mycobacterium decipiens]|uniref:MFS transporter n=1 Tax=Mycobacterium decipiens TaxID=1430326 RepID=A0A1X2LZ04_9MYCO|nr:MFS transporter [Mycobacterium decipiens]
MALLAQFRSFNYPSRVLMINHFCINVGFFMLMPYLADYLNGPLGLAVWAVGLVTGVRNFSQQGMFFVGGTIADRFGYKPPIVAGCLIQTGGFALLTVAHSLPSLLIAAAATGLASALFSPAVRAYLAADSGDRKIEAFAVFNVFYQAGILVGPLVGSVLLALNFRIAIVGAAGVFAALTVAQLLALPQHVADPHPVSTKRRSVLKDWRIVVGNRSLLWFAAAMTGRYVLSFQVYMALPIQASVLAPDRQSFLVAGMFALSGLVAVTAQLRVTRWFASRWGPTRSLVVGAMVMAGSFVPLELAPNCERFGAAAAITALLVSAVLLTAASAVMFPFEMRTVVALSDERLVATHQGFYSTIMGIGVLVGNLGVGSLMSVAHRFDSDEIVWGALILVGLVAAAGLYWLEHRVPGSPRPSSACIRRMAAAMIRLKASMGMLERSRGSSTQRRGNRSTDRNGSARGPRPGAPLVLSALLSTPPLTTQRM